MVVNLTQNFHKDDIDTKSRRTTTFRRLVRALTNFIDSDNVGIRRNTQGARDWGKVNSLSFSEFILI